MRKSVSMGVGDGFRLLTEPASLKRRRNGCTRNLQCVFPAPHRAGLIEALDLDAARAGRRRRRFPAPHRAGLIEACTSSSPSWSPSSCFRLLTEPASLKQRHQPIVQRHQPSFRLLTEPASLKRRQRGCAGDVRRRFPAPHRAGLIEAGVQMLTFAFFSKVSGSSQSRPH